MEDIRTAKGAYNGYCPRITAGGKKMARKPPACKAILLCVDAFKEHDGTTTIKGVFDFLRAPSIPFAEPPFFVYARLANGIGKYAVSAEIRDLMNDTVLGEIRAYEHDFTDRDTARETVFRVSKLTFPRLGAYEFVIFADGTELKRHKFEVKEM
jgi:hypothetical protein